MPIPFKTSVITDEIDQDFEAACKLALEYNLDAVEIRSVYDHGPFEFTADDIGRIKAVLAKTGLKVCAISAPFFKCKIDDREEIKSHLKGLESCAALADELGADLIRGFTFWAEPGKPGNPNGFDAARIASRFGEAAAILEKTGKTLVLESDPSVMATNGRTLGEVIEAIGSPRVRGLWDAGNDIWDPLGETPFPDGYAFIKKWLSHVHLKDGHNRNGKIEGAPIGTGVVDWEGQFRALVADGYAGYVSLETHYRKAREISNELLALPKGAGFSAGGYEATRESLGLWKEMLEKIAR